MLRISKPWKKKFIEYMFSQNTLSSLYYKPTNIKEVKTVPCYKHKLMRPSIGIVNLQKMFPTFFGYEIV